LPSVSLDWKRVQSGWKPAKVFPLFSQPSDCGRTVVRGMRFPIGWNWKNGNCRPMESRSVQVHWDLAFLIEIKLMEHSTVIRMEWEKITESRINEKLKQIWLNLKSEKTFGRRPKKVARMKNQKTMREKDFERLWEDGGLCHSLSRTIPHWDGMGIARRIETNAKFDCSIQNH
jgi:hypothetical protein